MATDHDQLEDAVAAYVLDACEDDERQAVEAHLAACPSCRELARRLSRAVSAIPLASEEVEPPGRLRSQILSAAAAQPPSRARPLPHKVPVRPARSPRLVRRPGWLRRFSSPSRLVIAGLAAALVALAAWNVQLNQTLSQGPTRYVLTGQGQLASAHGTTTVFEREGLTVASFSNLPEPTPGKVYQLWLIDDQGKAASAGVFTPDRDGAATLALDRSLNGVRTVAVTSEAGPNGAPAPTQTPQLAGTKTS